MCQSQGASASLTSSDRQPGASKGRMQREDGKVLKITFFLIVFHYLLIGVLVLVLSLFLAFGFYPCIKQAKNSEHFCIFPELQPKIPEREYLVANAIKSMLFNFRETKGFLLFCTVLFLFKI